MLQGLKSHRFLRRRHTTKNPSQRISQKLPLSTTNTRSTTSDISSSNHQNSLILWRCILDELLQKKVQPAVCQTKRRGRNKDLQPRLVDRAEKTKSLYRHHNRHQCQQSPELMLLPTLQAQLCFPWWASNMLPIAHGDATITSSSFRRRHHWCNNKQAHRIVVLSSSPPLMQQAHRIVVSSSSSLMQQSNNCCTIVIITAPATSTSYRCIVIVTTYATIKHHCTIVIITTDATINKHIVLLSSLSSLMQQSNIIAPSSLSPLMHQQ